MKPVAFILLLIFPVFFPHHAQAAEKSVGVSWKIPFLPLTLHVGTNGVRLSGSASIATPLGTFSAWASGDLIKKERPVRVETVVVEKNDLLLVIRNPEKWGDKIFKIADGKELSVFTNGQTLILAKTGALIIDVSKGDVTEISFAGKQEILRGSASERAVPNETIPMELKIFFQKKDSGMFEEVKNGGRLYSGDLYKLALKTPENAHVYVFNTDEGGKSVRLFPMKAFKGVAVNNLNPVIGDKIYYIPSSEKSFRLDAETGTGKIWYVAMRHPDPKLESQDFEEGQAAPVLQYLDSLCKDCVSVVSFEHR